LELAFMLDRELAVFTLLASSSNFYRRLLV